MCNVCVHQVNIFSLCMHACIHTHVYTYTHTQACYGITTIPKGEWLCKACLAGEDEPECVLCPNRGGALKRVRPGNTNWAHLSCALWIPEIRVGNIDKMEPITSVDAVPVSQFVLLLKDVDNLCCIFLLLQPFRRNLVCYLCRRKYGACVQCSVS